MTHVDQTRFDRAALARMPADPRLALLLAEMLELSAILPPSRPPEDDEAVEALFDNLAI